MRPQAKQDVLHRAMRLISAFAHTEGQIAVAAEFCALNCKHELTYKTMERTICCDCGVVITPEVLKKGAEPDYVELSRTAFSD